MYGAEAVILQLSAELTRGDDASSIGVFHHAGQAVPELHRVAQEARAPSSLIECRGQLDPAAVRRIRSLAGRVKADVVHAHGYKADLYTFAAFRGVHRLPLVSSCHTWYDNDLSVRLYGAADRRVLRHFDEVVAVSTEVRNRLLRAGVAEARVHLIRNGVDVARVGSAGALRPAKGPGEPLQVGLVGRLAPEKGVDLYLRAAAIAARRFPEARFVVAGEGPERATLAALLARLGLGDRAALVGAQTGMEQFYGSLDLQVSASRQEGMPMALLEGMASALPVVATRVGEVPTVVDDGVTGLLVEPGSPELLAEAIAQMLGDGDRRAQFGAAGRLRVVREFSAQRMAAEYKAVYERAVSRRGERAAVRRQSAA